ncbi:MAG: Rieske (2Fe-2S) protein [Steroidobacteraceae bacterium]
MHKVGCLADLRNGQGIEAVVEGSPVAVFEVEGSIVATRGKCPHAGGPLAEGTLDGVMLSCPWHGWSFDLQTGVCTEDPDVVLPFYTVNVEGDDVFVSL